MKANKLPGILWATLLWAILLWVILGGIVGCSGSLSGSDYLSYVNQPENGLIKEKKLNHLVITLQYRPVDYVIALEQRGKEVSTSHYKKRKAELETSQYYKLRIMSETSPYIMEHNLVSLDEAEVRRQELLFGFQPKAKMVCGTDTMYCALHHVEETFGLAPYVDINLIFPRSAEDCDPQIILEEFGFQTGRIKFKFDNEKIRQLPALQLTTNLTEK